jgi:predicted HTH transcriptional regulator
MALLHVPLSQVNEQQLQRLIDGKVAEARSIEYKRDTYGDSEADRAEYLADVSSFANTAGGDLIIGMAAAAGVPTALTPLKIDLDGEVLRLDNMVRSSLQPRIAHIDFKPVPVASGGLNRPGFPGGYLV